MKATILRSLFVVIIAECTFSQTPTPIPSPVDDLTAAKQRAERLQDHLNNYANYARYREANARLAAPAKDGKRVVFMGDSITDSWQLDQYFSGETYINRGISGQTTSQMLLRFRADVIALKPRVVVILAGTNDIAGNTGPISDEAISDNLASMIDLAKSNGVVVVLASIMPVSDYNRNAAGTQIIQTILRPPERIVALNNWIRRACRQRTLVFLDYFSAMVDDKGFLRADLANDGLHPNAKGYAVMAPLAGEAIRKALKMKPKK